MEKINYTIYIVFFFILIKIVISDYTYYYNPKDVIKYIN